MSSFNRVILMGNLTRDIELRYTPSGLAVTKVGLAINDRRKDKAGQWIEETCFVDVTMFGKTAELADQYLSKGSPIHVEGKLRYETWEKDGQKHSKLSVVCDRMQFIGSKSDRQGGQQHSDLSEELSHAAASDGVYEENIPF